jgi:hypothetical protein
MFVSKSKAWHVDESSCLIIAGCDGHTANAEHWRQQRWHIYIVYVPPHAPCPWFGMSAMFRAMAAKVRWVKISTSSFQVFWDLYFVSHALDLLFGCLFLHATWVGLCLGILNPVIQLWRVGVWPLSLYLTFRYKFVLWGGWISKLSVSLSGRWVVNFWSIVSQKWPLTLKYIHNSSALEYICSFIVSHLDMYCTNVLMYRTMVLLACLTKVRR